MIRAELKRRAKIPPVLFDEKGKIQMCIKVADSHYDKAVVYKQSNNLEEAYVQFMIFVKIVLDVILKHSDYKLFRSTSLVKEIVQRSIDVSKALEYYIITIEKHYETGANENLDDLLDEFDDPPPATTPKQSSSSALSSTSSSAPSSTSPSASSLYSFSDSTKSALSIGNSSNSSSNIASSNPTTSSSVRSPQDLAAVYSKLSLSPPPLSASASYKQPNSNPNTLANLALYGDFQDKYGGDSPTSGGGVIGGKSTLSDDFPAKTKPTQTVSPNTGQSQPAPPKQPPRLDKLPRLEMMSFGGAHDLVILKILQESFKGSIPPPKKAEVYSTLESYCFQKDDFGVSFIPFIQRLPPQLMNFPFFMETNRCFYLHLGIATGIHPLLLQFAFRNYARLILPSYRDDVLATDIIQSVLDVSGFVDANVLTYIFPKEFESTRFCFICEGRTATIISNYEHVATGNKRASKEVIILYRSDHFCLLRPYGVTADLQKESFMFLDSFLDSLRNSGAIVCDNEINTDHNTWSIYSYLQ